MHCLILDDEPLARREMALLISAYPWLNVVGEAQDMAQALALYERHRPELLFVDVELQGESGFDFLSRLPDNAAQVILVTAHDRYALQGYDFCVCDYLLKPVPPERLARALERVRALATGSKPLWVKVGGDLRLLAAEGVSYILAEGNYSRVYLQDGASLLVLRALKRWPELLPAGRFVQVHRRALVRVEAVVSVRRVTRDRREAVLRDGTVLPVGASCWPALKAVLG